ncbi:MAG TPA: hypothetical protein DCG53_09230 [Syntrophus sp. (in: bacteria)]|jgi:glycosyltransferase involved in cell wall biosynthesis|nr:hypothetical protein [Syntrophus sp. (in: bacteria)]
MNIEDLIISGKKLYIEGNLQEAKGCFLSIITINPYHLEGLNNLAVILFYEGQNDLAQDIFKKILSIDPVHKDGLMNLYDLLNKQGEASQFIPYMEMAMAKVTQDHELGLFLEDIKKQICQGKNRTVPSEVLNAESFFVLSSGRCGSKTLNEVINTAENVRSFHTSRPEVGQGSLEAFWNRIDKKEFLSNYHYPLIQQTSKDGFVFGETSPAITAFSDVLAETIPKAKFVILVRDPLTFTRSALFQNFYHGHGDDTYRFTPSKDTDTYIQWKKKSQADKICWLWNEFNNLIEKVTENLDQDRFMVLHFEDLFGNVRTIRKLFDFLNLKGFSSSRVSEVIKVKRNANNYGRFPAVSEWSHEFRQTIEQSCWKYALKYGYVNDKTGNARQRSTQQKGHIKKRPVVTIGLPLYSGGAMLADAIESILSQDYTDIELMVSDHGSDPFVREVCTNYQKMDRRVKYLPTDDRIDYLGCHIFQRMIELAPSPFFMWASYDDRLEKSCISKCMEWMERDKEESIALVYPRSKVFNKDYEYLGIGNDSVKADQDDPCERFVHVIRELQMCNAIYGLFRNRYVRKTRSMRVKNAYAHDNLFLAEIALLGKIIQIDDALFIRILTRKYDVTMAQHYAEILYSNDPVTLEEGLSLPFCRFTYAHCELINHSIIAPERKEALTNEIVHCFRIRWKQQLDNEIERLMQLVKKDVYYFTWDSRSYDDGIRKESKYLEYFNITDVLKRIREAIFLFPDNGHLHDTYKKCIADAERMSRVVIKDMKYRQEAKS